MAMWVNKKVDLYFSEFPYLFFILVSDHLHLTRVCLLVQATKTIPNLTCFLHLSICLSAKAFFVSLLMPVNGFCQPENSIV